mmetsp:Transcript_2218/g.6345  ORF Transcript_2218/g.6345 Transcript_2218/m.6345 type:complete len:214 (+) Transcript_2218:252-893(+)
MRSRSAGSCTGCVPWDRRGSSKPSAAPPASRCSGRSWRLSRSMVAGSCSSHAATLASPGSACTRLGSWSTSSRSMATSAPLMEKALRLTTRPRRDRCRRRRNRCLAPRKPSGMPNGRSSSGTWPRRTSPAIAPSSWTTMRMRSAPSATRSAPSTSGAMQGSRQRTSKRCWRPQVSAMPLGPVGCYAGGTLCATRSRAGRQPSSRSTGSTSRFV